MEAKYPNLELIEYKMKEILKKSSYYKEKSSEMVSKRKYQPWSFDMYVFPQLWESTRLAFDFDEEGRRVICGGDALTKAYTVVVEENSTGMTAVFVDNMFCYLIAEPNQAFRDDFRACSMATISESMERYRMV